MDVYPFNREFRLKLIALAVSPAFVFKFGHLIKPEFFELDDERDVTAAIRSYIDAYGKMPTDPHDLVELCEYPSSEDIVYEVFDRRNDYDLVMAGSIAVQWAKEQAAKIAVLDSVDDIKRGDLAQVIERMQEALRVGDDLLSPGIDVVSDINYWLYEQWVDKVYTGWPHLDIHLEGGLGAGELGVLLAPSNRGKSMGLVNIAYGAAGLGSAKNVVIFTHEMAPKIYAKRFGARMLFRFPKRGQNLKAYEEEFVERARELMPGKVKIVGGPESMSVHQMEDSIKRLIDDGFNPNLIIDDYADLLLPPRVFNDHRFELTAIYRWLRSTAGTLNVPLWTASQTNRDGYNKALITEKDIAEDIGKVNTADVIVALCQTKDEEEIDRCRLYLVKARDAGRGRLYDAKYYPAQQAIISIGVAKHKDDADA